MQLINLIKPTHICNLACTYCYNDDVRAPIMSEEVLERVIEQTFSYVRATNSYENITFFWHGGEPMVAGLPFYQRAVDFQKKHCGNIKYDNNMQTNGILINANWLAFLKGNEFKIGISIDGPKELHDKYRVDHRGRGSFDRVFSAIEKVKKSGVPFGVVLVISKATKDHVEEIYEHLVRNNLPFNLNPTNRSGGARETYDELGLEANEYGEAWIRMYDRWFNSDPGFVEVQDFVAKTRSVIYGRGADCVGLSQCGNSTISTDPLGDVYPCGSLSGHYDTRYGNIVDNELIDLMRSTNAIEYRHRKVDPHCAQCKWQHVCHGGCPARAYKFYHDNHRRDYYCPSLYMMYEHIEKRLQERGITAALPHPDHLHDGLPSLVEEARILSESAGRGKKRRVIPLVPIG